jgi:16S rRNA (guanine527-N7)-methyltransferase
MPFDPFSQLSRLQREKLERYEEQLLRFNQRVNLISPETEKDFRTRHLLHCLTLTVRDFPDGCTIVDWGTGGGLPAIPLAICEPEVTVVGVDSVGKKSRAVRTIARRLGLDNCFTWNGRAEEWTGEAHYSVSRATAPLADLWRWHRRVATPSDDTSSDDAWRSGLLALKGGDLGDEIADLREFDSDVEINRHPLGKLLGRNGFFGEKEIVAVGRGEPPSQR